MKNKIFLIIFIYSVSFLFTQNNDLTSDYDKNITVLEGEKITIFGAREKNQDIKEITKDEIDKINPADLADLLEKKENITITKSGAYGNQAAIGIRGMGSKRIAVLIDGVPVNSEQSGDFDLSKINVSNIEKIEIIKGGSDSTYNLNGAIGGVINIITKRNNQPGFMIYSSVSNMFYYPDFYIPRYRDKNKYKIFSKWYDLFDTQNLTFGFGIGNKHVYWKTDWSGVRAFNHYIYKDVNNIKRRMVNNEVYDTFLSTYFTINLPNYMKLILSGDHYYAYKYIPGPMTSVTTGKQIDTTAKGSLFFDADRVGSDLIDTELIFCNNFTNKDWDENIDTKKNKMSRHLLNTITMINRWGFVFTQWFTFRLGGDFSYTYLKSTDLNIIHYFGGGGWITAEFDIKKKVQIIPSVKLVYFKRYPVAIPKLGLVFNINENWLLKNNYYRTYKIPALDDLYWPKQSGYEGNPSLNNEDGVGGDIILCYNKKKILTAETSFYITFLNDTIIWQAGSGGIWKPENAGRALYFGSDSVIKSDFSKYVYLSLNYSFLLSYYLTEEITMHDDRRMPYTPIHNVGFGAEFNWEKGQINILGRYSAERYTTTDNVTGLKSYFTFDINFSQNIKVITIFASVKNIFNSLYSLVADYPMPGGSVLLGIKVKYEKKFDQSKKQINENNNLPKN